MYKSSIHHPKKHFGQHFLFDHGVIAEILKILNPQKNDHLIEIGPGKGALTLPLLKQGYALEAIELDDDLVSLLKQKCDSFKNFKIYSEDVLMFDFSVLKTDERLLRVFGNLPYNISTPLIFHLLGYAAIIKDMIFMLQKEVALRLCAKANTEHYGRLSVMVQYHCDTSLLFNVSPKAFYPPPQVQSSMLRITPYISLPHRVDDYQLFSIIVREAFGKRRKTIRNSLKDYVSDNVWTSLEIHSDLRAENLDVKDYVAITNALTGAS